MVKRLYLFYKTQNNNDLRDSAIRISRNSQQKNIPFMKKISEFHLYRMARTIRPKDISTSFGLCAAVSSLDNEPITYAVKYGSIVKA
jgi:hypothetical protein